ncbi:uncharacterized protein LOC118406388 [Branchiostoma floridae]|uniref:Uncharacterized protein LOC118406388 n=1 Tax=Branchiostoma floridae TaxID=7739 RepID=A0A9J7KGR4_BRAFL|nr:uncharacterized protein LOC118406388 [Branchiostoma floridae]
MFRSVLVLLAALVHLCTGESVTFPSGEVLNSVDDVPDAYVSAINTSSLLFDSEGLDSVSLSVYVPVSRWKSPDQRYFRANPTFIACLQNTSTALSGEEKPIEIAEGYRIASDSPSSDALTTGEAAVVRFTNATAGMTVNDIVRVAIQQCVPVFEDVQRNIGITVTDDTVLIQMRPDDGSDLGFESDWWTYLDSAYDLATTPTCEEDTALSANGDKYPSTATSAEAEVGAIDSAITRDSEDFRQLVQYPASHILFADEESSSSWCGAEGASCNPCASHPVGFTPSQRCADRVMSKRLYTALLRVDKHVRAQLNARLRITEAWDEPHSGAADGDQAENSLHNEGRAAKLELSGSSDLTSLAKYCICADIDYVEHKGTYLFVAVQKQEGYLSNYIEFDNEALVPVLPPSSNTDTYDVSDVYTRAYLFDSDGKEDKYLCDDATIGDFKDPDERYFRLDPTLVKCYQAISTRDNKYNNGAARRKIVVNVGYRSTPAQSNEYGINDPRYNTFNRGYAMQLSYEDGVDTETYNPARLATIAASQCGKLFKTAGVSIGLGLYTDSIFVDMRNEQELWVETSDALPADTSEDEWFDKTDEYVFASEEDRIIEPDDPVSACLDFIAPEKQSSDFEHPSSAKRRKKRTANDVCTPSSSTTHCSQTAAHRDNEVSHVMSMVVRKYLEGDLEDRLRAALRGCTGACGTCMEGSIWDEKVRNCNNFMHWVPFNLGNNETDVTNIHPRNNLELKAYACHPGHCIIEAPLFSLLVQSVDERYRPDPAQSAEQELYSSEQNPLPIMDLLYKLYAMHARGQVNVWVATEEEINSLESSLQVAMVYNKDVTGVTIYVTNPDVVADVETAARKFVEDWATSACTEHTRDTIAPLTVEAAPAAKRRRSPEYDLRDQLLEREQKWEERWMQSKLRSGGGM